MDALRPRLARLSKLSQRGDDTQMAVGSDLVTKSAGGLRGAQGHRQGAGCGRPAQDARHPLRPRPAHSLDTGHSGRTRDRLIAGRYLRYVAKKPRIAGLFFRAWPDWLCVASRNHPDISFCDLLLSLNGAKMNRNGVAPGVSMKTAALLSLHVEPTLRRAAEEVLRDGESLSGFVERAVRAQIQQRQEQAAFIVRGLASRDQAKATGVYFSSGVALKKLEARLAKAKKASA